MNILRSLSGTKWGSSSKSLLMVYRSYIRSLLDYGCEAYDSASESIKKGLNSIQYQALRICMGALPLTPLDALQAETGEMPLDLRRQMLTENFKYSVSRIKMHPLHSHVQPCWQFEYLKLKKCNKPFGYRTLDVNTETIEHIGIISIPPWTLLEPHISLELKEYVDKSDNPHYKLQCTQELIQNKWHTELHIFTDGSHIPGQNTSAAAFWVPALCYKQCKKISYSKSSFKAELAAIILALTWVEQFDNLYVGVVIFSDSLSGLLAIRNVKNDNMVKEILILLTHLKNNNIKVSFEWIPAHCGIQGNETADKCAKAGHNGPIQIYSKMTLAEAKQEIKNKTNIIWQQRWANSPCLLKQISLYLPLKMDTSLHRKEEKIFRRLRFGIIGLKLDLFRLGLQENGLCDRCLEIETVLHYLVKCPQYMIERAMLIIETNIMGPDEIMNLLRSSNVHIQRALVRFVCRTGRFKIF